MKYLVLTLLVLVAAPAVAEEETDPEFDVEIIVFRHLNPDDSELQVEREEEDSTEIRRRRFASLAPDQLRLGTINQELLGSRDWSPVLHYGWRQPVAGRDDAAVVSVAGNRRGAYASGTVRVSLERFLRLELDLEMDPGSGTSYRLEQARRMRSGEVHYFDHPQFGVIALISRPE